MTVRCVATRRAGPPRRNPGCLLIVMGAVRLLLAAEADALVTPKRSA